MQVGLMAPQGWKGEYDGWDGAEAWTRTVELAEQAEDLGFESLWVSTTSTPCPSRPTRSRSSRSRCCPRWRWPPNRVRLGHMVVCAGFRNPALTAKLSSTIDVISGGRFELGIGAGWKEDEWRAYGYGFPSLGERWRRSATTSRSSGDVRARSGDIDGGTPRPWRDQRAKGPSSHGSRSSWAATVGSGRPATRSDSPTS